LPSKILYNSINLKTTEQVKQQMKNLVKSALIAACVLLTAGFAKAQTKLGHINFQNLVTATPQFKTIQGQIDAFQKTYQETLTSMQQELQTKGADYQSKMATMTDPVKAKTESELQDLQKRIQDFSTKAQNDVQAKYNELTKPLLDQLRAAINAVAKEKGYNYVLDSSTTEMLVSPDADDLMAAVKAKLGPSFAGGATAPAAAPTRPAGNGATKKP